MKHLIILGDGMADWKIPALGDKTVLEASRTPYMDLLAQKGQTGLLKTVQDGYHPGSEVANMSIMGYDMDKVYQGRGVLEAANIGVELDQDDMAMRCNLVCLEGDTLKNHSSGHITTEEAAELIKALQEKLGGANVTFHSGIQYRHLLVIHHGNRHVSCTPPHDVPLQKYEPLLPKPISTDEIAFEKDEHKRWSRLHTASLLKSLILRSREILENHPVNLKRKAEGKDMANSIWPWSPGYRPAMEPLSSTYPEIKNGSVISAVDLINGIGHYAGLRNISVEGATGLYDTNYEGKAEAAIQALKTDDFVYLHVEASDEAGHEGNVDLKIRTVEDLDRRIIGPIYEAVKDWDEPVAIAVLPDHPTPCALRTHCSDPVPFLIWAPGIEADSVTSFSENTAKEGSFGLLEKDEFIKRFLRI